MVESNSEYRGRNLNKQHVDPKSRKEAVNGAPNDKLKQTRVREFVPHELIERLGQSGGGCTQACGAQWTIYGGQIVIVVEDDAGDNGLGGDVGVGVSRSMELLILVVKLKERFIV